MNFDHMWSVHHGHTDVVYVIRSHSSLRLYELFPSFWIIAIPVMFVVAPAFMWPDIVRAYNHITKGMLARNVKEACLYSVVLLS
jgi:hypothetical protein